MPHRDHAPIGAPCWADLWTSDVPAAARFYGELFGWTAEEPSPEFGGYFMFTRGGVPVAGGMGDMPDAPANNTWKIYLATDDIVKTVESAAANGAQVVVPAMPVADLGVQAVLVDPTGAEIGAWQPGTFPGFVDLDEPGAPSWFELHTRDHADALHFYRSVFAWETDAVGDTDEFRYSTVRNPEGEGDIAGIMDASAFMPAGTNAHWSVYWHVDDTRVTAERAQALGGAVIHGPEDTPYGVLASCLDPMGALFKLRTLPAS